MRSLLAAVVVATLVVAAPLPAAEPEPKPAPPGQAPAEAANDEATQALYEKFARLLKGVTLKGKFTILGKDGQLKEESYDIVSVEKSEIGDYWVFNARVKYGGKDVPFALPLEVKWAGKTPVITMNAVTIPGLGTFDARVLFHENMYVGTWRHGEVRGHLFGTFEKSAAEANPAAGDK